MFLTEEQRGSHGTFSTVPDDAWGVVRPSPWASEPRVAFVDISSTSG
ncbi:hypothetical protein AB0F77_36115 [Streptomyces sp. NPDC026672]